MKKICVAAICAMMLCTGCASEAEPAAAEPARFVSSTAPEVTVEQVLNEYNSSKKTPEINTEDDDENAPLAVVGCARQIGDSYILYPRVGGAAEEDINRAICDAVMARAEYLGMPVFADYRVEYNRNGLFSIRMFLYDLYSEDEGCIDCIPLTFNSETGEQYCIGDLFDSENQNWRGRIPDIITSQAADCQMVLLGDILPISDDRPFYITDEAVVIMYDLYEIATYSAGQPEFEIPVDDIAECLNDTSVLNAMLPDQAIQQQVQEEPDEELLPPEQPVVQDEISPEQAKCIVGGDDAQETEQYAQEGENGKTDPGEPEPVSCTEEEPIPEEVQ